MPQDIFEILQEADILFSRGNYEGAFELLSHAEQVAQEKERKDALAPIYSKIGKILTSINDFENAKKYLEQALKISKQLSVIDLFCKSLSEN